MKEKALEYIDQYIDYLKEIKDGASKNSQKIAKLQAMYHGIAHDRLSNYQSFFDNYKQPFSAQEKALKYIDRYIDYLKKLKNDALKNSEKITELQRMSHEIANYTLTNYQSLFDDYEQTFSEQDWTAAVRYFTDPAHVDTVYAGNRNNGLMYSYVKTADEVLHRRQEERGCGFFGRVRSSQQRTPSTPSVIKRQKFPVTNFGEPLTWRRTIAAFHKDLALRYEKLEAFSEKEALRRDYERISALYNLYDDVGVDRSAEIIAEYLWLPMVKREAEISLDVGVALSPLVIKRDADGFVCSVYQEMKDFGAPLLWTLEKLPPEEDSQRLDYAIQLLLQVSELHAGRRVVSGKKICHRDVKLDNLLCDGEHVQLVDFGFAKDTCDLDQAHRCNKGTEWNMPYNYRVPQSDEDINACVASFNEDTAANKIIPTPSYFFDDKIATLRTMYHHLHSYKTIFSDTMYKHLPNTIQTLLDTSNIEKCIQQDAQHSLQFIASVLILYKEDKNICTEERLNSLAQDPLEQARLIAAYRPSVTLAPQGQAFTPS